MTAPEKPTDFGWFFLQKMKAAGLSQSDLSRRSTVPQSTISRYILRKNSRRDPDLLRLLAPHINVDPDALVALSGDNGDIAAALHAVASVHIELSPLAERINRLLGEGSALPETDRRDLERIIGGLVTQYEQSATEERKRNENRAG